MTDLGEIPTSPIKPFREGEWVVHRSGKGNTHRVLDVRIDTIAGTAYQSIFLSVEDIRNWHVAGDYERWEPKPKQRTFEWPCDRRDAHGRHLEACAGCTTDGSDPAECPEAVDCPGVKAHPGTMAGGSHYDERPLR